MTTLNIEFIALENQRLAKTINDLGEIISRENLQIYQQIIITKFNFARSLNPEEEKKFLSDLYNYMIDKLKELKFE